MTSKKLRFLSQCESIFYLFNSVSYYVLFWAQDMAVKESVAFVHSCSAELTDCTCAYRGLRKWGSLSPKGLN